MEQLSTLGQTAISSPLNDYQTTFTVTNAKSFPQTGTFRAKADDEIMTVTTVVGLTWTVVRGTDGTTAASHSGGTIIRGVLTNDSLYNVISEGTPVAGNGPIASRPALGNVGGTYFATDNNLLSVSDGVAWKSFGPLMPFTEVPVADLTPFNMQGTYDFNGGLGYLIANTVAGDNVRVLEKPLPAPPFTVTIAFTANDWDVNYNQAGVCVRQSSNNYVTCMSNLYGRVMEINRFLNNTYQNTPISWSYRFNNRLRWYRYAEDSTTRTFSWSPNGVIFNTMLSESRTNLMTADRIGIYVCNNPSGWSTQSITAYSWTLTTP